MNFSSFMKQNRSSSTLREKKKDYQWMHPLYNPIDYKLWILNRKFEEIAKSQNSRMKNSQSQVSFNDLSANMFKGN